jgi:hypothetical protein
MTHRELVNKDSEEMAWRENILNSWHIIPRFAEETEESHEK